MSGPPSTRPPVRLLPALLVLAACDAGAPAGVREPDPALTGPIELEVLRGNDQSGIVGGWLPQPVVLRARAPNGLAVKGVAIAVQQAQGIVRATESWRTGADGAITLTWVLGERAGPQSAEFVPSLPTGGSSSPPAIVRANALPGFPDMVTSVRPLEAAAPGPNAVEVVVTDQYWNPAPGSLIRWTATEGTLSDTLSRANERGVAVTTWTPPPGPSITIIEAQLPPPNTTARGRLYRLRPNAAGAAPLAGWWDLVAWNFYRDSLQQDHVADLVSEWPGVTGSLAIIQKAGQTGFRWYWQSSWGNFGQDVSTGDLLPGPEGSLAALMGTLDSNLECDWGPCAVPFQGRQRFQLEGDRLTIESLEPVTFWTSRYPHESMPSWPRLVLRRR